MHSLEGWRWRQWEGVQEHTLIDFAAAAASDAAVSSRPTISAWASAARACSFTTCMVAATWRPASSSFGCSAMSSTRMSATAPSAWSSFCRPPSYLLPHMQQYNLGAWAEIQLPCGSYVTLCGWCEA